MATDELTPEEALQRLHELFGGADDTALHHGCRKYILELENGKPVFRPADDDLASARSEAELIVDQIIAEEFGDDIVPRKLAKLFPGSPKTVACQALQMK
jgi:hypothetical protein